MNILGKNLNSKGVGMFPSKFEDDQQPSTVPVSLLKEIKEKDKSLGKLDSTGIIHLDITISHKELKLFQPPLGDGGYGIVYRGQWKEHEVAVKKLKVQAISNTALKELCKEAEIMFKMGLESSYIVPVKKICLEASHYALVMELMPKGSLFQLLKSGQSLPWSIRYQIALDVCYGLRDLHERNILHRDLKSRNILLDDRLRAKLTDFGLSKIKQETTASQQTFTVKGTAQWMAPELFKRGAIWTTAVDIYSLGMVLWELVTREIPFKDAQDQVQLIGWITGGEKEAIPENCPLGLKSLIESCWESPDKRPKAVQAAEILKPLLSAATAEEKKPTLSQPIAVQAPTHSIKEVKKIREKRRKDQLPDSVKKQRLPSFLPQPAAPIALPSITVPIPALQERMAVSTSDIILGGDAKEANELKNVHNNTSIYPKRETTVRPLEVKKQVEFKILKKEESKLHPQILTAPSNIGQPVPLSTAHYPQRLMPAPKVALNPEQLTLQDELIAACEQGDSKATLTLLRRGAKPNAMNSTGKYPLGAAVWSMNPEVIGALLKQMNDVSPVTWEKCEKHNLEHYKETFIISKFEPKTFEEWGQLLKKMEISKFVRGHHLKKADELWHDEDSSSWNNLVNYVTRQEIKNVQYNEQGEGGRPRRKINLWYKPTRSNYGISRKGADYGFEREGALGVNIERDHAEYRAQIKKLVESASKRPESNTFNV